MKICPVCKTESPPTATVCPRDGVTLPADDGRGTGTKMLYDPLLGELIDGRYKIETRLGEGALSTVYAATHELIEKRVALKVLKQEFVADAEVVERFLREAKAASRLSHENIISLSDFGKVPSGAPFFVMELLDGRVLADRLYDGKPLPIPEALRLVTEIGRGLAAAHQHGVVHRDLKPDNIGLVRDKDGVEHVKILDFGLAKITQENRKLTRAGQVLGTPEYMSPEQASGQTVDHRSDIFAVGILLYRLCTGQVPFAGKTFMAVISKVLSERPRPPRSLSDAPELTAGLEAVILRALCREPEGRYPTMDAMLEALRSATSGPLVKVPGGEDMAVSHGDIDSPGADTWLDPGPPGALPEEDPPPLEDHATGPTAIAPVAPEGEALPATAVAAPAEELGHEEPTERVVRRASQGRSRRPVLLISILIGLLGMAAGVLLAVFLSAPDPPRRTPSGGSEGNPSAATGLPDAGDERGRRQVAPMPEPRREPPEPPARQAAKTVQLELRSVPRGASVYLDNRPAGRTPLSRSIPVGSREIVLSIVKPGYQPRYRRFRPQEDVAITVTLSRSRRPAPNHMGSGRPRPGAPMRPRPRSTLGDLKDPFAPM